MKKTICCLLFLLCCAFNSFADFEVTTGLYIGGFSGPNFDPSLAKSGYKPMNFSLCEIGWSLQLGYMWGKGGWGTMDKSSLGFALLADMGVGKNARGLDLYGGALGELSFKWIGIGAGVGYGMLESSSRHGSLYLRATVPFTFRYAKLALHYDYYTQPDVWKAGIMINLRDEGALAVLRFLFFWIN